MNHVLTSGPVWYLMRASGVVSLLLLTAVSALGVATTSRLSTRAPAPLRHARAAPQRLAAGRGVPEPACADRGHRPRRARCGPWP